MASFSAEPLAHASQVALRSERCPAFSHLPVPPLPKLLGANSHGNFFVVSVDPPGRTCCPKRATRDSVSALPNIREWLSLLCPLGELRESHCVQDAPAEPFAGHVCTNGSALLKDHIPPRMDLQCEGSSCFTLQVAESAEVFWAVSLPRTRCGPLTKATLRSRTRIQTSVSTKSQQSHARPTCTSGSAPWKM